MPDPLTPEDRARARELWNKLPPGPWYARATDDAHFMNARYVGLDEGPGFAHDGGNGMAIGECEPDRVVAITLLQTPLLVEQDACDEITQAIAESRTLLPRALADLDAKDAEIERLTTENNALRAWLLGMTEDFAKSKARLSALDCREVGTVGEVGGSHCPSEKPCLRCRYERRVERVSALEDVLRPFAEAASVRERLQESPKDYVKDEDFLRAAEALNDPA